MRIYRRIHQFDLSRPFEPYLLRSVVNATLNIAQKSNRHLSLEGDLDQVEGLLSQAALVELDVEYLQLKQKIIAALARLEPRQRAAVVQRYYLEMSEKEMAVALDTPPGTVKWLLNTARAKLRNLLDSEGSTEWTRNPIATLWTLRRATLSLKTPTYGRTLRPNSKGNLR